MGDTGIEWTDATWNPTIGCSRKSEGCRNCYAEEQAARIVRMAKGRPTPYDDTVRAIGGDPRWTGIVKLLPERLALPLGWRKPRRIFVNSMSDLFHERLADEEIAAVVGVMVLAAQHTYQVLTKRADRMREFFSRWTLEACLEVVARVNTPNGAIPGPRPWNRPARREWYDVETWPVPWIWLGVSVEDQAAAEERGDDLEATPAAVRFWSVEPMLGPVDARRWLARAKLHQIIAGCESGPGARPSDAAWFRSMRDQCKDAGVAFFLKQATEEGAPDGDNEHECTVLAGPGSHRKPGGIIGAPYLDGVQHLAFPEVRHG